MNRKLATFSGLLAILALTPSLLITACGGGPSGGTPVTPVTPVAPTPAFSVLVTFDIANGKSPQGNLIFDSSGNLYGTTSEGGTATTGECAETGCGVVFKLTPGSDGAWTETVLHSFTGGNDGYAPGGGLVFDGQGNLYGVTAQGGGKGSSNIDGCGTVFRLAPNADGTWAESILYAFTCGSDGRAPLAGPTVDSLGNLYGTTSVAGDPVSSCGTVFELSPGTGGQWALSTLHTFAGTGDGCYPWGQLVRDSQGDLFGTTTGITLIFNPGADGSIFELSPVAGGSWNYTVIHEFTGAPSDGSMPHSGLTLDSQGNLYGTTTNGGTLDSGAVFEFVRSAGNTWTESILYNFQGGTDGQDPWAQPVFDSAGNLYGTTAEGGGNAACEEGPLNLGCGTIYKLKPTSNGNWTEGVLYIFTLGSDGGAPADSLVLDSQGNLYGTAASGPANGGTVFMWR